MLRKINRLMRRERISSGGVRSRSSFFATSRDGCFRTRDVYYGVAADAMQTAIPCVPHECHHTAVEFSRVGCNTPNSAASHVASALDHAGDTSGATANG